AAARGNRSLLGPASAWCRRPQEARAENAFQGAVVEVKAGSPLRLELSAYVVVVIRVAIGTSDRVNRERGSR
ncbi:MAG: hypothetical protein ABSG53_21715, partial [Thermoguttaceae bacterium]